MNNREVAAIFYEVADMLQIKGEIIHRVLSYRRAAETIEQLPRDINAIHAEDGLTDLPGIGETLAEKIDELLTTGELTFHKRLAEEVPQGVVAMMKVNGVGPKKAARFWQELGITNIELLQEAAEAGKLRELSGMGKKSEANILEGIKALARQTDRASIGHVYPLSHEMLVRLLQLLPVERC
ncbi:MAG: helix-hairpin-helix domain-containing protein, partial [Anaerolineae bacterium]